MQLSVCQRLNVFQKRKFLYYKFNHRGHRVNLNLYTILKVLPKGSEVLPYSRRQYRPFASTA